MKQSYHRYVRSYITQQQRINAKCNPFVQQRQIDEHNANTSSSITTPTHYTLLRYLTSASASASASSPSSAKKELRFTFRTSDDINQEVVVRYNTHAQKYNPTILDVAQANDVSELEGICEGSCECSTCHVILERGVYDALGGHKSITDAEQDMLDQAAHVTETSRLGCQIRIDDDTLNGSTVYIPEAHVNLQER